jgi:ASPM-SPD-2-Hydin domain-containing protein
MRGRARALGGCLIAASFALLPGSAVAADPNTQHIKITPSTSSANPLGFGSLCVGRSSTPKTFTITNTAQSQGGQNLEVTSITGGAPNFAHSGASQNRIGPQDSAIFSITFTPQTQGTRSATVTVNSNDPDTPQERVYVTGTGVDRRFTADRSSVSFGEQRVGTRSPTQSLIVRNTGGDPVTVSAATRRGANAADFRVTTPVVPFTIAAGAVKTITIAFQPSGEGLRSGALELLSNACSAPKVVVSLVGTGVVPNIAVDPNPVDVGASPKGKPGKPMTLTLSNDGRAALKITEIQILGADAADFALTGLPVMPVTVQPAGTIEFSVRMTASQEGLRIATINVISDDPDAPAFSVPLRGNGGTASPSPRTTVSPTPSVASPTAKPTSTDSPQAIAKPTNDSLAVGMVVGGVVFVFGGLLVIRRLVASPDED